MSLQCGKGSNGRISRIAQMNMNLLVIWSILSRELSKVDMELKLEIQGNFLLQSAAREGRISFRDLIGAIRIRVPYFTMAALTICCPKNIILFLLQNWFNISSIQYSGKNKYTTLSDCYGWQVIQQGSTGLGI